MYALWLITGLLLTFAPLLVVYVWRKGLLNKKWALGLLPVSILMVLVGGYLLGAFYEFVSQ